MAPDRAYMDLSPAERLVSYLQCQGVTFLHLPGDVLRVTVLLGCPIPMPQVLEALAAHNQEILALIPEGTT